MQKLLKTIAVRFSCHDQSTIASVKGRTDISTKGVKKECIGVIELDEVLRVIHLGPICARREIQQWKRATAALDWMSTIITDVGVDQKFLLGISRKKRNESVNELELLFRTA